MISADDYCIKVCKAKCCVIQAEQIKCPLLTADCKCSIYKERFGEGSQAEEIVGWYTSKVLDSDGNRTIQPVLCSRIETILKEDNLPLDVRAQCCYANPELLNKDYNVD